MEKLFSLFLILLPIMVFSQSLPIQITGSFYDDSTGLDLPAKVYSLNNNQKGFLGESRLEEAFIYQYNIILEVDADSLLFKSEAYQQKQFPLHFFGKFGQKTYGNLAVTTLQLNKPYYERSYVVFCLPENANNKYKMIHYYGNELHCETSTAIAHSGEVETSKNSTSHYIIEILSSTGKLISEVEYKINPGINFIDLSAYTENHSLIPKSESSDGVLVNSVENDTMSKSIGIHPIDTNNILDYTQEGMIQPHPFEKIGFPELYFEQSKYDLSAESINLLDEILEYLNYQKDIRITVKGFTDGVGDKALNETLAKYRAQVVAAYLINKGVDASRISTEWQKEAIIEPNAKLSQYRKVIIKNEN